MTNKDKFIQTPLIIDQETLDRTYTNETLDWQSLKLKSTIEHLFVNCTFPSLIIIEIKRPKAFTFIGCTFSRLLIADVNSSVNSVFGFCIFPPTMFSHIDDRIFNRCRCSDLDYHTYLSTQSEQILDITNEEKKETRPLDLTEKRDPSRESPSILDIIKEEVTFQPGEGSPQILEITRDESPKPVRIPEQEQIGRPIIKFMIRDSYL